MVSDKTPEVLQKKRDVSEKNIRQWFDSVKEYAVEYGIEDVLDDPRRILNTDESGFPLCPKTSRVIAPKGSKNVLEKTLGNPKENITAMLTVTASGEQLPGMIVYANERISPKISLIRS